MEAEIIDITESLEMLTDDLPAKVKTQLLSVIEELKSLNCENPDANILMKIQDELETISNVSNLDYYTRNEIINAVTSIESIYNG